MPIYEYECKECKARFEKFHRAGDREKPACPSCGSGKVARVISPAGFVLKGSGWYKTDYPSEARKKAMESEKSHKVEKHEKKEGAADPKPAEKAHQEPKKKEKKAD